MIKSLIFDFDGTIADTFETIKNIVKKDLGKEGEEGLRLMKDQGIKGVLKKKKVPIWKLPGLTYKVVRSLKNKKGIKLFPEIPNIFKKFGKKYKIGIVSSNSEENIKKILKENNAKNFVEFIYSDISLFGKHITLQKMCKKYKLNPEEVVYIGDEDRDIVGAKKAKVKMIAVTWGYNSERKLKAEHPDYLVNSSKELVKVLNYLNKN